MGLDEKRRQGTLLFIKKGICEAGTIRLAPLACVTGKIGLEPGFGILPQEADLSVEIEGSDPSPIIYTRVRIGEEFLLPLLPGRYVLHLSNAAGALETPYGRCGSWRFQVTAPFLSNAFDLGELMLTPGPFQIGKEPPPWHIDKAHGIAPDITLADFKGRWLVVEFWGYG